LGDLPDNVPAHLNFFKWVVDKMLLSSCTWLTKLLEGMDLVQPLNIITF
jgi:hypothetical protein